MSVLRDFERKLESLFEGVFLKAFKSGVQPVEVGKKLVREAEGNKTIGVSRVYMPNRFQVGLSTGDKSRFESYEAVLVSELENLLISYAKDKDLALLDHPRVRFKEDKELSRGQFRVESRMEGDLPTGSPKPSVEREATGTAGGGGPQLSLRGTGDPSKSFSLDKAVVTIGRMSGNDIVLPDMSVSRKHAQLVREDVGYRIEDLDSTNGTYIDGQRITSEKLRDGNVVRLGSIELEYRGSGG